MERIAGEYLEGDFPENWDLPGLYTQLEQMYPVGIDFDELDANNLDRQRLIDELREDIVDAYADREEELGDELMRALERFMLLQIIDERWREHLHDMDYLREGIHLRGFAQIDPLVAYKNEGFEMFTGLMNAIWEEFGRYIFVVEVEVEGQNGDEQRRSRTGAAWQTPARRPPSPTPAAPPRSSRARCRRPPTWPTTRWPSSPCRCETRTVAEEDRIGRNDPCWCGSGKKYKKCHGA